jgi:enoyl-CoA hydratase/carnithine racemase
MRWGLISRTVPDAGLDDAVDALAARVAATAPPTVSALKRTTYKATSPKLDRELCARLIEA